MNRPVEFVERNRVNGFSILDDDFDVMLGDLCREPQTETSLDKIHRLLGNNRTSCLDLTAHYCSHRPRS